MNRSKSQQATHRATLKTLPTLPPAMVKQGKLILCAGVTVGEEKECLEHKTFNRYKARQSDNCKSGCFISLAPLCWLQLIAQLKAWLTDWLTAPTFSHTQRWWFGPLMVPTRASDGLNFPDCHPIKCQGRPIRWWESLLCLPVTVSPFTWLHLQQLMQNMLHHHPPSYCIKSVVFSLWYLAVSGNAFWVIMQESHTDAPQTRNTHGTPRFEGAWSAT